MKYYVLLGEKNEVVECIPEVDEVFPGIPIEERYQKEFLDKCIVVYTVPRTGYIYDAETKKFSEPPLPEPTPVPELPELPDEPIEPIEPTVPSAEIADIKERLGNVEDAMNAMMEGIV